MRISTISWAFGIMALTGFAAAAPIDTATTPVVGLAERDVEAGCTGVDARGLPKEPCYGR